jgi:hypothetical protein
LITLAFSKLSLGYASFLDQKSMDRLFEKNKSDNRDEMWHQASLRPTLDENRLGACLVPDLIDFKSIFSNFTSRRKFKRKSSLKFKTRSTVFQVTLSFYIL